MNDLSGSFTPSNKKPQKQKNIIVANPAETLINAAEVTGKVAVHATQEAVKDMWAQIMGVDKYAAKPNATNKGDMTAGKDINLKDIAKKENKITSEAPMSYFKEIKDAGKNALYQEKSEIQHQLQSIMYELQRIASSSKIIEKQVTQAVGTGIVSPGKGHVNFLEMVLQTITIARKRVENAGAWLMQVRKKSGGFNKKNMSHLMSGERSVSNQTN